MYTLKEEFPEFARVPTTKQKKTSKKRINEPPRPKSSVFQFSGIYKIIPNEP
jgi:hypothetical protein